MIHSKISFLAVALGAAATFGFVWLGRRPRRALAAPPPAPLPAIDPEDAARADALRDLDAADPDDSELDFFDVSEVEPNTLETVELRPLDEEAVANDEPYDAVDPESMGTEFLRRATEAYVPPGDSASLPVFDGSADVAAELPVGRIESDGSAELRTPERPNAPATDLSPNNDELEQRRGAETKGKSEQGDPSKPNE
jgi:hypothetical protein